jgi:hypothetical protein
VPLPHLLLIGVGPIRRRCPVWRLLRYRLQCSVVSQSADLEKANSKIGPHDDLNHDEALTRQTHEGVIMIRICFAGITGWTAKSILAAIAEADDLTVVAGVARTAAGQSLTDVTDQPFDGQVCAGVAEALQAVEVDVMIDYTSATQSPRMSGPPSKPGLTW